LQKKGIKINYFVFSNGELEEKPLTLKKRQKIIFSKEVNNDIKRIIRQGSKRVTPGYKKKIKAQIFKIKQKMKREYIDAKYKEMYRKKGLEEKNNNN
jgi:ATP-dependent RNA helicase CshB